MADVISSAVANGKVNYQTTDQTKWTITFTNNENRKGRIVSLGNGNYLLQGDKRPYYFSAAQVVYMTISDDQS